jgi:segregation and condensation protein B
VIDSDDEQAGQDSLVDVVEAVVFASPEPVQAREIAEAFDDFEVEAIEEALEALIERYASARGGLFVEKVAGGYRFATRPEVGDRVRTFFRHRNRTRLTPATLEGLAIIAYRQPVTAPEIQSVRGKDPSYALKVLLEKKLIRILGRKKVVGNPLLYGTTQRFLEHFGLDSLSDLPSIEEFDSFLGTLEVGAAGAHPDGRDDESVSTPVDSVTESADGETGEAESEDPTTAP